MLNFKRYKDQLNTLSYSRHALECWHWIKDSIEKTWRYFRRQLTFTLRVFAVFDTLFLRKYQTQKLHIKITEQEIPLVLFGVSKSIQYRQFNN